MWESMRFKSKRDELEKTLGKINKFAAGAISEASRPASSRTGEILGTMRSIFELTAEYSETIPASTLLFLINQKIIWSNQEITDFETSPEITEIWLVTSDLKPDSSDEETGKVVHENIMEGKTYVYFYPDNLYQQQSEIARLRENILRANRAHARTLLNGITLVALNHVRYERLFYRGNTILFFRDRDRVFPPSCFEEVVLTKVSERGIFWQEHPESIADETKRELELELPQGKRALGY
jgi:hypothetical protein